MVIDGLSNAFLNCQKYFKSQALNFRVIIMIQWYPYNHCIYEIYHSEMDIPQPEWPEKVLQIIFHVL